jgi:hypothetical protein
MSFSLPERICQGIVRRSQQLPAWFMVILVGKKSIARWLAIWYLKGSNYESLRVIFLEKFLNLSSGGYNHL